MNQETRLELLALANKLESISTEMSQYASRIEEFKDAEDEKFTNLTEGLQQSEKGQEIEAAAGQLAEAFDNLGEVISNLDNAVECLRSL